MTASSPPSHPDHWQPGIRRIPTSVPVAQLFPRGLATGPIHERSTSWGQASGGDKMMYKAGPPASDAIQRLLGKKIAAEAAAGTDSRPPRLPPHAPIKDRKTATCTSQSVLTSAAKEDPASSHARPSEKGSSFTDSANIDGKFPQGEPASRSADPLSFMPGGPGAELSSFMSAVSTRTSLHSERVPQPAPALAPLDVLTRGAVAPKAARDDDLHSTVESRPSPTSSTELKLPSLQEMLAGAGIESEGFTKSANSRDPAGAWRSLDLCDGRQAYHGPSPLEGPSGPHFSHAVSGPPPPSTPTEIECIPLSHPPQHQRNIPSPTSTRPVSAPPQHATAPTPPATTAPFSPDDRLARPAVNTQPSTCQFRSAPGPTNFPSSLLPPPRPRVSLACQFCRSRKLRCSAGPGPCEHCSRRGRECVFEATPRGVARGRGAGAGVEQSLNMPNARYQPYTSNPTTSRPP